MKITTAQLREIISEEIKSLSEKRVVDSQGNEVYAGGLPGTPSGRSDEPSKSNVLQQSAGRKYVKEILDGVQELKKKAKAAQSIKSLMGTEYADLLAEFAKSISDASIKLEIESRKIGVTGRNLPKQASQTIEKRPGGGHSFSAKT